MNLLGFGCFWAVEVAVAAALTAPIVFFGHARAKWKGWELVGLVVPVALWSVLTSSEIRQKSPSNLIEILIVVMAIPIIAGVRVWLAPKIGAAVAAAGAQVCLCLVAVGAYFLTPWLPK